MTIPPGALTTPVTFVQLSAVVSINYGKQKPSGLGMIPVYGSGGRYGYTDKVLAGADALVVGRKGTAGAIWWPRTAFWPADTTFYLEPETTKVDTAYLYYWLSAHPLSGDHAKTTLPSLQKPDLEQLELWLPPLEEQRRIARILSTVQCGSQAHDRRTLALRTLRRAAASELLTGAENTGASFAFNDVVTIVSGQVDPRRPPYSNQPHIAPDNIESGSGRLLPTRTAAELGLISGKYAFRPGDVLYSKIRPYLNKAVVAPFQGTCSADMYVFRSDATKLLQPYLHALLLSDSFLSQAISFQNRTGIPKINREELATISLILPDLPTQGRIAGVLNAIDNALIAELRVSDHLGRLMASCLTALLRGEP